MQHVDALSRNPTSAVLAVENTDDWFLAAQLQDEQIQNIYKQLQSGEPSADITANYCIRDGRPSEECSGKLWLGNDC